MTKRNSVTEYFRAHLHDVTDECMIWPYSLNDQGYGQLRVAGRPRRVHILACIAHHGPMPQPRMEAAHGPCHSRACWNWQHVSWKTAAQNQADKIRDGTSNRGERCAAAKLTEADVLAIRRMYASGATTQAIIGDAFGVSRRAVSLIVTRQRWAHI